MLSHVVTDYQYYAKTTVEDDRRKAIAFYVLRYKMTCCHIHVFDEKGKTVFILCLHFEQSFLHCQMFAVLHHVYMEAMSLYY